MIPHVQLDVPGMMTSFYEFPIRCQSRQADLSLSIG